MPYITHLRFAKSKGESSETNHLIIKLLHNSIKTIFENDEGSSDTAVILERFHYHQKMHIHLKTHKERELALSPIFANDFNMSKNLGGHRRDYSVTSTNRHNLRTAPNLREALDLGVTIKAQGIIDHAVLLRIDDLGHLDFQFLKLLVGHHTFKDTEISPDSIFPQKPADLLPTFVVRNIIGNNTIILPRTHIHHLAT